MAPLLDLAAVPWALPDVLLLGGGGWLRIRNMGPRARLSHPALGWVSVAPPVSFPPISLTMGGGTLDPLLPGSNSYLNAQS